MLQKDLSAAKLFLNALRAGTISSSVKSVPKREFIRLTISCTVVGAGLGGSFAPPSESGRTIEPSPSTSFIASVISKSIL